MLENKAATEIHSKQNKTLWKSMAVHSNIPQYVFICAQQKKETQEELK